MTLDLETFLLDLRYPVLVTAGAVWVLLLQTGAVGQSRGKHKVPFPKIDGPPEFERTFRAHQNTVEQLSGFLISLWIFSIFVEPKIGGLLGAAWVVLRYLYGLTYYKTSELKVLVKYTVPQYFIIFIFFSQEFQFCTNNLGVQTHNLTVANCRFQG